ncbi:MULTISPECIES: lmo0937 family membrane protein [Sphingomonadaceae]|uniref:Lmo0937 family membrane protein n=1 Tax=Novosphingobium clariflavum TaxID=2029884 RepID=A0ABV6SGW8_9SPHN|nr:MULTISPECIES: lmo0937 family membrane protein [Sphingomonadaceae]QDK33652.1 lmo0937 family membrane protein [Sphingomonas sp. IC081]
MLFTIAAILIVLWLLGFVVFHVSSALIHVLLVVAIVVGLVQLFRGRRV